jgi:hypothetical protein
VQGSKVAMGLVEKMERISGQISEVQGILGEIEEFPSKPTCWR